MFYENTGPNEEWRANVRETLKRGVGVVEFEKANGQNRLLKCTLDPAVIPQTYTESGLPAKQPNGDVQAVWDIEANAWRSFRFDRVKSVKFES